MQNDRNDGAADGDGAQGLFALWTALAGGWAGTFTPLATLILFHKLTTPAAQAAHMRSLGYDAAFELQMLACLAAATGVIGGPTGLAGSFAATAVRERRGANWPELRTGLVGSYLAGVVIGAVVAIGLSF